MALKDNEALPELYAELQARWPNVFANKEMAPKEIAAVPTKATAGAVLLAAPGSGLVPAMAKAGYWHRGLVGVDVFWRV